MGFAVWRVFYNVYLEDNGFTGTEIGIIAALLQATIVFVVPVWGVIADKRGIRPTLWWVLLASAIMILFLGKVKDFWWLMVYVPVLTIFHHPLGPLTDALAVQYAKKNPKYNYGNLRLWGSFGWAIASVIGGYIFLRVNVAWIFPVSASLFIMLLFFLRSSNRSKNETIYKPDFQPIDIKSLVRNKTLLIFLVILTLYGITCSPINAFINLYFKDLGANNWIIGLAYAIQAFSECPFFIIGNRLVNRFGTRRVIIISMIVMVFRLFCYGLFPNVSLGLAMGLLQGITLSFFLVAAVDYLHQLLPANRHATAQSVIWGLYFGLGHTFGNLAIGVLKDLQGMISVMIIFGIMALAVLLFTSLHFLLNSKKNLIESFRNRSFFR
jgi:PPP family 3-phenylpropionic acid transporter